MGALDTSNVGEGSVIPVVGAVVVEALLCSTTKQPPDVGDDVGEDDVGDAEVGERVVGDDVLGARVFVGGSVTGGPDVGAVVVGKPGRVLSSL